LFTISAQLRKSSPEVTELAELDTKHTAATNKLVHTHFIARGAAKIRLAIPSDAKWRDGSRDDAGAGN
jgi:hypothetical protein